MRKKFNYFLVVCSLILAALTPLQIANADDGQVTIYSHGDGTRMNFLSHGDGTR